MLEAAFVVGEYLSRKFLHTTQLFKSIAISILYFSFKDSRKL